MTTIDNLMALHDEAAGWKAKHYWQDDRGTSESVIADYEKRMKQSREALRTALTEALAAQPVREPVAWMYDVATYIEGDVRGRNWRQALSTQKPNMPWMTKDVTPLYATPQTVQEPSCTTCKHCTVSDQYSFEETCFVCCYYYDSKYEVKT